MREQLRKYAGKLVAARAAAPGGFALLAHDDVLVREGDEGLGRLGADVLSRLTASALVAGRPFLPFAELLARRAGPGEDAIVPRDTETRTFLHDIPVLRRDAAGPDAAVRIARLLGSRKGIVVEGLGIVAVGALTVEQAYIHYCSVFHATYIKYLLDLLRDGFLLPGEKEIFDAFRREGLPPLSAEGLVFRRGPLSDPDEIRREIAAAGRYTVERGLVDSFFGNVSYRSGGTVYISQTAASLDELGGCIDPVPADDSSTAGITASSELLAHRKIYEACGGRAILHGHPRFAVAMSMVCEEKGCAVTDCWRDCEKVRFVGDTPVVAGEIGAGGLARRVPPAMKKNGRAIVYGHGVFTLGAEDFREAFEAMVDVERRCRAAYLERLAAATGAGRRTGGTEGGAT